MEENKKLTLEPKNDVRLSDEELEEVVGDGVETIKSKIMKAYESQKD